jgi:hypothetical protein
MTLFFGMGIIFDGIGFGPLFGLTIGFSFSITAIYFIHQLVFLKEFTRVVSKEIIVFKSNEVITHQFKKDDIEMIHIDMHEMPYIEFQMKTNKKIILSGHYTFNVAALRKELMLYGYPVDATG